MSINTEKVNFKLTYLIKNLSLAKWNLKKT